MKICYPKAVFILGFSNDGYLRLSWTNYYWNNFRFISIVWNYFFQGLAIITFTLRNSNTLLRRPLLCNFIKITLRPLRHVCSPVNLLHIFKTPFPKNTSGGLLMTSLLLLLKKMNVQLFSWYIRSSKFQWNSHSIYICILLLMRDFSFLVRHLRLCFV